MTLGRSRGDIATRDEQASKDGHSSAPSVARFDAGERSAAVTTLDVSSVSKHFGGVYALRDVSLTCRSGEIVGLIGPNGAGKTTLLNVISSAFPLDTGEVRLDERRIDSSSPRKCAIAGIARTFQNIRLFGRLTVRQNVEVGFTTA